MRVLFREFAGYAAASGCALAVDVAILAVLVDYFSWWYLAASITSFLCGLLVAYALSVTLVFKQRRIRDRRTEFASFAAIGAIGLALNSGIILVAVKYLGLHYLVAKGIAACATFICNFISRRQLLFAQRSYS